MSTKTEIVVYGASYRKVFSASFRRMSFSTAMPVFVNPTFRTDGSQVSRSAALPNRWY